MQSILIVGQIEKAKEAARNITQENKISKFDVEIIETEKTVGIGDIRSLQKKLFLKQYVINLNFSRCDIKSLFLHLHNMRSS